MNFPKILGISGSASTGKDLFADLIIQELKDPKLTKLSLAEQLKRDCSDFLIEYCNVDDSFNPSNKSEIRPFWTWYGDMKRKETSGRYFIDALKLKMDYLSGHGVYNKFIVPDVRYKEYPYDEIDFIRENGGVLVYLDKYEISEGHISYTPPANHLEERNNPYLRTNCDYHIKWINCKGDHGRIQKFCVPEVHKFLKWLAHQ